MKAAPFAYRRPDTVAEVTEALQEPDAKVLAGGQSLVPMLVMRLARPAVLVDINGVEALMRTEITDGWVRMGAVVRQRDVEEDRDVATVVPLLHEALRWVGHREIRNRGTIVGSIAHADPSAELPCIAMTLNATLTLESASGTREVSAADLFTGPFQTTVADDEVITHVHWPARRSGDGFAFHEVARRHGDFALCGAAAHVHAENSAGLTARIGMLGVAPRPVVLDATPVAAADRGERREAARLLATASLSPSADMHASAEYRQRLAGLLIERAVNDALSDVGAA